MDQMLLPYAVPDWAACTILLLILWLASLRHVVRDVRRGRLAAPRPYLGTHRGLRRPRARTLPAAGARHG